MLKPNASLYLLSKSKHLKLLTSKPAAKSTFQPSSNQTPIRTLNYSLTLRLIRTPIKLWILSLLIQLSNNLTTSPSHAATANVSNDQLKPCQSHSHSGYLTSTSKLKSQQSKLLKWYWNSQLQTQSNQVEYCHYWCGHAATFQGHSATAELNYDELKSR